MKDVMARGANRISARQQRGAVLAISMILLLVITLVGVSTMQSTGLEERMAANAQNKQVAFQASETAIEEALDDDQYLSDAYTADLQNADWPTRDVTTSGESITVSSEVQFMDLSKNVVEDGSAVSISIGGSGWAFYNYRISGTATVDNTSSNNTNVQGAFVKGPAPTDTLKGG